MIGPIAIRTATAALLAAAALLPARADETIVAAAASVREVVEAGAGILAPSGEVYRIHTGGSAALVRQIERGAPVALLVSASADEIDALEQDGRLVPYARATLAANRLVVVVPKGGNAPDTLEALAAGPFRRIAIANPRLAPAGRFAREALEAAGVWDAVLPRAVFGEHVRQVVEYVASGNADAGIVYGSDAHRFADTLEAGRPISSALHEPIRVVGALVRGAEHDRNARALLDWLASDDGRTAFVRRGFDPP